MPDNNENSRNEPLSLEDLEFAFGGSDMAAEDHRHGRLDQVFDKVWKLLLVIAVVGVAFSIYQHSLNGRYAFNVQEETVVHVLDTRTGTTYAYFSLAAANPEIWIDNAPNRTKQHVTTKSAVKP